MGGVQILLVTGRVVKGQSPSYLEELAEAHYVRKGCFILCFWGEVFNAC